MTGAQPNPIQNLEAEDEYRTRLAEEARIRPKYVGDLPDDPDEVLHREPERDEQDD
jgi:hypothetical protein